MRALSLRPLVGPLLLPALVTALSTGCEEPPPDDPPGDRLFVAVAETEIAVNTTTDITVTSLKNGSPGEGTVTVTVDDDAIGLVAPKDGTPAEVANADLDAAGSAAFTFRCVDVGTAKLSVSGPTGEGTATVECVAERITRFINVDKTACDQFLQADGVSDCTVNVTVRNEINQLDTTATLAVEVVSVVSAVGGGTDDAVLKADDGDVRTNRLDGITTDTNPYTFIVASPSRDTVQTMTIAITDDGGNRADIVVDIQPFLDRSSVKIESDAANLTEGRDTEVTITAKDTSGDVASGLLVTMTSTANLLPQAGGCLSGSGASFEATMDNLGTCTFTVQAADDVDPANAIGTLRVEFQPDQIRRNASIDLSIVQQGQVVANITADPNEIFADQEPSTATITADVQIDGAGLEGATVRAEVANNSRGVIRLTSVAVGADPPDPTGEDTAEVDSDDAGLVTFTVSADNALSRGRGTVTVTITQADGTVVATERIDVTVDRAPVLSTVVFGDFDPEGIIGVPGGPRPSSTGVSFILLDEENEPVPNVPVTFTAQSSVPGVTLVPFDLSDNSGVVRTVVTAGRVAGPITVIATVDNGLSAAAPPISVVGGLPNSAYSAVGCDTIAGRVPFSTDCRVSLADKFTNVVETELNVQFRAEGGNITPTAAAGDGIATGTFTTGEPGAGSADVRRWSYSPLRTPPSAVVTAFPGCFDSTTRTPCDILELCQTAEAGFSEFCPLPPNADGTASCTADISDTTRQALLDEAANPGDWELELFFPGLSPLANVDVAAQFAAYSAEHRACGLPVSCLVADANGLAVDDSDDCPVNAGCLDFSGATECPQDALLDILAAVRGEEGFDDRNGNGVRDNNEDFVDFPEPFLDKNSSCSYDDLNDNARLTAGQKVTLSDLFIDSDPDDGLFGFVNNGARVETNGQFDSDTEIFLKTTIVQLGAGDLDFGSSVGTCLANGTAVCPASAQAADGASASCLETAAGEAIAACRPDPSNFRINTTASLVFRWADNNGNCPTENFAGSPSIATEGPIEVFFNDGPYSQAECGSSPGNRNPERPWCADQPALGARSRTVDIKATCDGEEGDVPATLTFALDGQVGFASFVVGCPVCGDGLTEGDEECDGGAGCDVGECEALEGFVCSVNAAKVSTCTAVP